MEKNYFAAMNHNAAAAFSAGVLLPFLWGVALAGMFSHSMLGAWDPVGAAARLEFLAGLVGASDVSAVVLRGFAFGGADTLARGNFVAGNILFAGDAQVGKFEIAPWRDVPF